MKRFLSELVLGLLLLALLSKAQDISNIGYASATNGALPAAGKREVNVGAGPGYWTGNWSETKDGFRDELICGGLDTEEPWVQINVGSVLINGSGDFRGAPGGGVVTFELEDSKGAPLRMRHGVTIEQKLPPRIASSDMSRAHFKQDQVALWIYGLSWFTNGSPAMLGQVQLGEVYQITNEGDYKLTVGPVVYRWDGEYYDRIDLPFLSTNIHLLRDVGLNHKSRMPKSEAAALFVFVVTLATAGLGCVLLMLRRIRSWKLRHTTSESP